MLFFTLCLVACSSDDTENTTPQSEALTDDIPTEEVPFLTKEEEIEWLKSTDNLEILPDFFDFNTSKDPVNLELISSSTILYDASQDQEQQIGVNDNNLFLSLIEVRSNSSRITAFRLIFQQKIGGNQRKTNWIGDSNSGSLQVLSFGQACEIKNIRVYSRDDYVSRLIINYVDCNANQILTTTRKSLGVPGTGSYDCPNGNGCLNIPSGNCVYTFFTARDTSQNENNFFTRFGIRHGSCN